MPPSPSGKTPKTPRQLAEHDGRRAEFWAELYLRAQFFRVLHKRYKTPVGEIDLIVSRGVWTVFVEVKARKHHTAEEEALGAVNQQRIARAANYFLMRHPHLADTPLRFDVIFLAPGRWPRHVRNAFSA